MRAVLPMRVVLLGFAFAWLMPLASAATPVDFVSTGTLSCGSASNCAPVGSALQFTNSGATLSISYTANTETDLNVPAAPSFASTNFGLVSVNCTVCAGLTASFNLTGALLGLGVNQGPDPFNASGTLFNGTFTGSLTVTSGSSFGGAAWVAFVPLTNNFISGTTKVEYSLQQPANPPAPPGGYLVSIGNITSFQGAVATSVVPEASTVMLLGAGLAGLARAGRPRR